MSNSNSSKLTLIPVMIAFFTMGFVDLVGAVSNNMQEDFGLSDSAANFFPSLVFFWFLIFSVPTGMLMNKIGRKKTVLLSIIITTLAVFLRQLYAYKGEPALADVHLVLAPRHRQRNHADINQPAGDNARQGPPGFDTHLRTVR